jgi:hypothetical protein
MRWLTEKTQRAKQDPARPPAFIDNRPKHNLCPRTLGDFWIWQT